MSSMTRYYIYELRTVAKLYLLLAKDSPVFDEALRIQPVFLRCSDSDRILTQDIELFLGSFAGILNKPDTPVKQHEFDAACQRVKLVMVRLAEEVHRRAAVLLNRDDLQTITNMMARVSNPRLKELEKEIQKMNFDPED